VGFSDAEAEPRRGRPRARRAADDAARRATIPHVVTRDVTTRDVAKRDVRRRQISHDIRHELGTIMLLASLLSSAADVGRDSRLRARQLLGEARWLDRLHRAFEDSVTGEPGADPPTQPSPADPVRVDAVAREVVAAVTLSSPVRISFTGIETWARVDRLAYWRALRNLVGNAVRAAGPGGHVDVRVQGVDGWAVAQVDDDGPGFGAAPPGMASLGLGIVLESVVSWGGDLEIRRSAPGGCRVRLLLPAAEPLSGAAGDGDAPADL
jgi:signal transduction histidine kinase